MREVQTGRDRLLPPPRPALGPGERLIEGRVYYSAAWLSAAPNVAETRREGQPQAFLPRAPRLLGAPPHRTT
jgi:hypothetical protein